MAKRLENQIEEEKPNWKKALLAAGYGASLFLSSFLGPAGGVYAAVRADQEPAKAARKNCIHVVKKGDNLTKIFSKYGIKEFPETWAQNRGMDPHKLRPGQKLNLCSKPSKGTAKVKLIPKLLQNQIPQHI